MDLPQVLSSRDGGAAALMGEPEADQHAGVALEEVRMRHQVLRDPVVVDRGRVDAACSLFVHADSSIK